ncbi:MAG: T9SS type A sorting domain-containing protein [Bacteroidetes bacterium]|nr:T9SS type A sorting domain-containing protein [Bacteroidota bacterium]
MKKVFLLFFVLVASSAMVHAQNAAISACLDGDTVQIKLDYSLNCPTAPGSFVGLAEIGFHSGANNWGSVVDWDAAGSTTATNDSNDVFTVRFHQTEYHGLTDTADNYYFVFNQGPTQPGAPWDAEGKDDNGAGGCQDYYVIYDSLAACDASTSISDQDMELAQSITIAPNPMTDLAATVKINNTRNELFHVRVTNVMGQEVFLRSNLRGNEVIIEKGNMTPGIYFVTLFREDGAKATKRLLVN